MSIRSCAVLLLCLCACGARHSGSSDIRTPASAADQVPALLSAQMHELELALIEQGFRKGDTQVQTFLPQGAREVLPFTLAARTCVALVAMASGAVVDLDAGLYTPEGEALVEDDNVDARPVLSLCSGAEARKLYFTLHAYQGGGAVMARSFLRPERPSDRGLPPAGRGDLSVWTSLVARLKARGFGDDGPVTTLELMAADALRIATPTEGGSCYTWIGEADASLRGVSMRVLDEQGRELARAEDDGGPAALQLCVPRASDLVLIVSASAGKGQLRLSRFRGSEGSVGGQGALWLGEPRSRP